MQIALKAPSWKQPSVLPGFNLTLGYAVLYLSLIVLIPLAALAARATRLTPAEFLAVATDARVLAAFKLSFGVSLAAALVNAVFGYIVAWSLTRYRFPGRRLIDALIDLPFAMPTAVSGIALTTLYSRNGWIGRHLEEWGIKAAFTPLGISIALIFIGLPFVVRTLQPALEDIELEHEEAAASLGAGPWPAFRRVIFPATLPAFLTGFAMAFARALGEYGSVIFIAGNMPMRTEIVPLLIVVKLEQYDYAGATAIGLMMLVVSFALLLTINLLQAWAARRSKGGKG